MSPLHCVGIVQKKAIERAARHGVQEVLIGMAHRGRLNVLVNGLQELFGTDTPSQTVLYQEMLDEMLADPAGKDAAATPNP